MIQLSPTGSLPWHMGIMGATIQDEIDGTQPNHLKGLDYFWGERRERRKDAIYWKGWDYTEKLSQSRKMPCTRTHSWNSCLSKLEQPKCPLFEKWLGKLQSILEMAYCSAMRCLFIYLFLARLFACFLIQGLALLPSLGCSGAISAHGNCASWVQVIPMPQPPE